jgi:hypothetical protein
MEYKEFLTQTPEDIIRWSHVIKFKVKNQIPFSKEEIEITEHMVRYCNEVKLDLQREVLERCYEIKDTSK